MDIKVLINDTVKALVKEGHVTEEAIQKIRENVKRKEKERKKA